MQSEMQSNASAVSNHMPLAGTEKKKVYFGTYLE